MAKDNDKNDNDDDKYSNYNIDQALAQVGPMMVRAINKIIMMV